MTFSLIFYMCQDLMDSWTGALTEACRQEAWPAVARVHMLELLEMRSMAWAPSESVTSYYRQVIMIISCMSMHWDGVRFITCVCLL